MAETIEARHFEARQRIDGKPLHCRKECHAQPLHHRGWVPPMSPPACKQYLLARRGGNRRAEAHLLSSSARGRVEGGCAETERQTARPGRIWEVAAVVRMYLVRCANSVESVKSCLSLLRSAIHALRGARGRAAGAASTSARGSRAHAAAARGATQIQTSW